MRFVHLVPRLAPPVCGVFDYAMRLAAELEASCNLCSEFVIANSGDASLGCLGKTEEALKKVCSFFSGHTSEGRSPLLLLQYSGYGYAKRGAPLLLARRLAKLRDSIPELRLVTMFHELFASGRPTSSAFWMSPLQKWAAASLARTSDAVVTSRDASANWLKAQLTREVEVQVMPVFSNFGEPGAFQAPALRPAQLMVFGRPGGYSEQCWTELASCMSALQLEKLVIVSHPIHVPESIRSQFVFEVLGILDSESMADALSSSRFGFLDYNPEYMGKSGVLAAYAAHGVIPLFSQGAGDLPDGLREFVHFLSLRSVQPRVAYPDPFQQMQSSLQRWYAGHAIKPTAEMFARLLGG